MNTGIHAAADGEVALSVRGLTVSLPKGMERAHAVKDISFDLRRGQILCVIGESGSGKSVTANTIMGLLPKVIAVTSGSITLDGRDLRDFDLTELRSAVGVIFQDFVRYNLTAADNIAVGRIENRDDRGRVTLAAERSMADPVIRKQLQDLGQELPSANEQTPEGLRAHHKAEIDKWWPIIKAAGIKS